jgi:hypothetical protein
VRAGIDIWLTTFETNSEGNFLNSWRIFNASSVWITMRGEGPADDKEGLLATSPDGQSFREIRTAAAAVPRRPGPQVIPARIANGRLRRPPFET